MNYVPSPAEYEAAAREAAGDNGELDRDRVCVYEVWSRVDSAEGASGRRFVRNPRSGSGEQAH